MLRYRISNTARADIARVLTWSFENFGSSAEARYAALIAAAIRHAASSRGGAGFREHPEYGAGVAVWHLALSVAKSRGGRVKRPRHILVCRWEGDLLVVGRVLHHSVDPSRHVELEADWT